jgi:dCMP deaminase
MTIMGWDEYYMNIEFAVRKRANCLGRRVGAVIVRDNRIISTGYNGTPEGITNCLDGGCIRCKNKDSFAPGVGYDVCICVHAEQNALITAARFGNSIEGAVVYSTLRPCFDCTKAMLQAKVKAIYFVHDWAGPKDQSLRDQYHIAQHKVTNGVRRIEMHDPDDAWANNKAPTVAVAARRIPSVQKAEAISPSRVIRKKSAKSL